ncbi:MAG: hypothetical protein V3T18_06135 [Pseudomonadales bacterium]
MNRVQKQRLLEDMGIDVWQLRLPAGMRAQRSEPAGIIVRGESAENPPSAARESPVVASRATRRRSRGGEAMGAGTDDAPGADGALDSADEDRTIEPFSIFCFAQGGVMVMLQAADAREIGRFGRDLLAGACGNWRSSTHGIAEDVQETVFSWPPAGLSSTQEEAAKGLRAFTDKQLSRGSRKKLVVLSQSVADRLGGMALPESLVLLPPVAERSGNWELKRNLWLELQTHTI